MKQTDQPAKARDVLQYAIIADDLTGATDAGAAFALAGFNVEVALQLTALNCLQAEVVAITTNSRHDSAAMARRKVLRACAAIQKQGRRLIYKKLDSTVQGNIVAELEAARDAGGFRTVLVCPANPKQGRVVRHGILEVRGESLGSLYARFQAQGLESYAAAELPVSGPKVKRLLSSTHAFVIADAGEESDLVNLVRAARAFPADVLLAGSAGMAMPLAIALYRRHPRTPVNPQLIDPGGNELARRGMRPALILCGSQNPVTQEQIHDLIARGGSAPFRLGPESVKGVRAALERGHTVVQVPVHLEPDRWLRQQLRLLESIMHEQRVGALLLTGGDTARLICRWLRVRTIALAGEVLPGLAWGVIQGGLADGTIVCTKPGGFGSASSLSEATQRLSTHWAALKTGC